MKKYDEYKDSGVAWIGEMPKHWEVCKLKHYSHIVLGKMLMTSPPKDSEGLYTLEKYLKSKNVGWLQLFLDEDNIDEMWFNQYERSIYKLQENDIVMNEGGDIGKVSCWRGVDFDCYIQNSINKITADYNRVNAGFLCYWLYNLSSLGYFWSIVSQISIAHLTKEKLSNSPVVLPPISEQTAIATYLDTHCAKIDNLISIQQKRIALLQELKQSVITHAVTKGLNPNVEMKPSGVEWIGDVPKHWKVMPLKFTGTFGNGLTYSPKDVVDNGILVLRSSNIQNSSLSFEDNVYVSNVSRDLLVKKGDIIICSRNGSAALVGKSAFVDKELNATFGAFMMRYIPNIEKKYGFYLFQTAIGQYKGYFSTTTINQLTKTTIDDIKIPLAMAEEQAAIASYLDHKCATIDTSISNAQHQIELLQEYKQSLITEVVTGKRKVTDN